MEKNRKQIQMNYNKQITVKEAFELFIRKCKVKNLTDSSIESYQRKNHEFIEYVGENTLIKEIYKDIVDNFIIYKMDKGNINSITMNSYLRSIRAFLYYAMECRYMESFKISLIKAEKKIKETYTNEELMRLLRMPDLSHCTFSEFKIWAFENYLLATGNRISTALYLKIEDINFEDNIIIIRKTKNRKQQILPLSKSLAEVLRQYLEVRGGNSEEYLFCNNYGEKGDKRTYQQQVQNYNVKRKVNKTSCHLFRHTFAKQWILAGGDIFRLQKILGHSDLTVTKEYVAMFGQDLQLDFEKYNPLDNINPNKAVIKMK